MAVGYRQTSWRATFSDFFWQLHYKTKILLTLYIYKNKYDIYIYIYSNTVLIFLEIYQQINPLNAKLNPTCHLPALLVAHHILHVSRIGVNWI